MISETMNIENVKYNSDVSINKIQKFLLFKLFILVIKPR